ncbi:MAG TPA: SRPBCC family protein [Acidimicrobiia bacterium]|jgi:Polyketide cyclase / dehydrase and lipid transport|nr:SRPBCC family protein [Acidimicrobiia bacterium]
MGEARAEITINRSADDVWETVGNFGDVTWMPGVERSELDGDDRIVETVGMRLVEHQYSRDDEGRTLTYGIVAGDVRPELHRATITVMPAGRGCFVTWDVEADDAMVEAMQGAYVGALTALKEQLEA